MVHLSPCYFSAVEDKKNGVIIFFRMDSVDHFLPNEILKWQYVIQLLMQSEAADPMSLH